MDTQRMTIEQFLAAVLYQKPWYKKHFIFNDMDFSDHQMRKVVMTIIDADEGCKTANDVLPILLNAGVKPSAIGNLAANDMADSATVCSPKEFIGLSEKLRDKMIRNKVANELGSNPSTSEVIAYANRLVSLERFYDQKTMRRALSEYYDRYIEMQERKVKGETTFIETGIRKFDEYVRMDHGMLMTLGARTSIGKSLFALWIALEAAKRGSEVYYLNFEMGNEEVLNRSLGILTRGDVSEFRDYNADVDNAISAAEGVMDRVVINTAPGMSVAQVKSFIVNKKLDLLVLDYMNLMTDKADSEHQRLTNIANDLNRLAKERNIAIIVCCQLNRDVEKTNQEPELHHIKDSSGIEQASDVVALLHRNRDEDEMQMLVAKHRLGRRAKVRYRFDHKTTQYYEL